MEILKFLEDQGTTGMIIFALWIFHKQGLQQLSDLKAAVKECTDSIMENTKIMTEHSVKLENGAQRMDKIEDDIVILRKQKHRMSDLIQRHEAIINKGERYDNEIH